MNLDTQLAPEEFALLRATNTPTVSNAAERAGFRDRMEGFTGGAVRAIYPELGVLVGYAVTVRIRSAKRSERPAALKAYWDHIAGIPQPRVVVVQDLDERPGGAWWGEVNANIHRALGCVGVVTNGTVRDVDDVRPIGFHFFASGISVSHGYACPEEFNVPINVDGMAVRPGDLVHADKHGAIAIPLAHARAVLKGIEWVERYERPMIQLCKSQAFTTANLEELLKKEII
jgi:4-hydroxy-4-methyl-2-oxoglutarate aldolase